MGASGFRSRHRGPFVGCGGERWGEFAGDNDVAIFASFTPATGASDDPGETFGDISIGFSMLAPEGWSGFLRGNYQFSKDFEAFSGNAGLRYAW